MTDYKAYVDQDLEVLIPGFMDNRRDEIDSLRDLLRQEDFSAIENLGHAIKGTGGGYGFDKITDLGAEIEEASKDRDSELLKQLIIDLEEYLDNVEIIYQ